MNKVKTFIVRGYGWLKLIKARKSNILLEYHLEDINIEDYHIYKSTSIQREVSKKDLYEFKYASYILFDKKVYKKEDIEEWLLKIKELGITIMFLDKPFPSVKYLKKIEVYE